MSQRLPSNHKIFYTSMYFLKLYNLFRNVVFDAKIIDLTYPNILFLHFTWLQLPVQHVFNLHCVETLICALNFALSRKWLHVLSWPSLLFKHYWNRIFDWFFLIYNYFIDRTSLSFFAFIVHCNILKIIIFYNRSYLYIFHRYGISVFLVVTWLLLSPHLSCILFLQR